MGRSDRTRARRAHRRSARAARTAGRDTARRRSSVVVLLVRANHHEPAVDLQHVDGSAVQPRELRRVHDLGWAADGPAALDDIEHAVDVVEHWIDVVRYEHDATTTLAALTVDQLGDRSLLREVEREQ